MLARTPVISLAYSGLADLVSDETAITVPYDIEPAASHLSVSGSVWARPDIDALRAAMREATTSAGSLESRERVERAAAHVAESFSWRAVADRWVEFISDAQHLVQPTSVAMVSTWNSKCGIAEYSKSIVDTSPRVRWSIFANSDAEPLAAAPEREIERCWTHRYQPDLSALAQALDRGNADVVHIQFNFGFFEVANLAKLVEQQRSRRGVVITMHRTKDLEESDGSVVSLDSIASTLRKADCLIVHQQEDVDRLREMGLHDNVLLVPHGAAPSFPTSAPLIRDAAGFGNRPLIGTFGFLLPHKGLPRLIAATDALRNEFPDLLLVALCAAYPIEESYELERQIRAEIEARGLTENVLLDTRFLDSEVVKELLACCDAIALPYEPTAESASGAMRSVLAAGRAIVASDLPIFKDAAGAFLPIPEGDPEALSSTLRELLINPTLQRNWSDRARSFARRISWASASEAHAIVYGRARDRVLLGSPQRSASDFTSAHIHARTVPRDSYLRNAECGRGAHAGAAACSIRRAAGEGPAGSALDAEARLGAHSCNP